MDSDYKYILYHTDVRWLSKGKVLNRFMYMKVGIIIFTETEEIHFEFMRKDIWWLQVWFLSDLFGKLYGIGLGLGLGEKLNV